VLDPPVTSGGSAATTADAGSGSSVDTASGSAGSVVSGGYELSASGGTAGDTNSSGTDPGVFFSGGGMVQLDAMLSQFAGVVSGFDPGDGGDLRSLGFGSSSSATPWTPQASGSNGGGGQIWSLALLGKYAANFSAGADGSLITDPAGVRFRGPAAFGRAAFMTGARSGRRSPAIADAASGCAAGGKRGDHRLSRPAISARVISS
jgi:hypothetical protein